MIFGVWWSQMPRPGELAGERESKSSRVQTPGSLATSSLALAPRTRAVYRSILNSFKNTLFDESACAIDDSTLCCFFAPRWVWDVFLWRKVAFFQFFVNILCVNFQIMLRVILARISCQDSHFVASDRCLQWKVTLMSWPTTVVVTDEFYSTIFDCTATAYSC